MSTDTQTKQIVFSIVTPSFNQSCFLEDTIKSVLSQEGNFLIDYIIVDGGSTDGSVEIIKKYETLLTEGSWPVRCGGIRYRWVSEEDKGQADAISKGFHMAEGEVLAWLNSDDTYLPGALDKVAGFFQAHPGARFVYGKTYYIDEKGKVIGEIHAEPFDYKKLAARSLFSQQSTFLRKDALDEVGELNLDLHFAMDYDLWIRIAGKFKLEYLPVFLSSFRLHGESKTISALKAYAFNKELLMTAIKHYGWAPLNRVYFYSYNLVKLKLPAALTKVWPIVVFVSLLVCIVKYLGFNKGIRLDDIKMINIKNVRKLFMSDIDIIKGDGRESSS
jgi:glycosyltransferase involved in cell wall biosynthesis